MKDIRMSPIGRIHTPHVHVKNSPIQPFAAQGVKGYIELLPEYAKGLKDIEGFTYLTLIYSFHEIKSASLQVIPFMDTELRGIFACRAPQRPNAIGLSTVRLTGVEGNRLHISDVDMLDGSPLLDIKPFYPKFDNRDGAKSGWLDERKDIDPRDMRSDERFL